MKKRPAGGVSMTIDRSGTKTIHARGPAAAGALLEAMRERYQGGAAPAAEDAPGIKESWEATVQALKARGAARGKMPTVDALRLVGAMGDLPQTTALVLSLLGVLEALPAEERRDFDGKIASLVKVLVSGLNPAALEAAGWKVGQ